MVKISVSYHLGSDWFVVSDSSHEFDDTEADTPKQVADIIRKWRLFFQKRGQLVKLKLPKDWPPTEEELMEFGT